MNREPLAGGTEWTTDLLHALVIQAEEAIGEADAEILPHRRADKMMTAGLRA